MEPDRSLSACLGHILGGSPPDGDPRSWLARRNLGLAPVVDPSGFQWGGSFLARLGEPNPRWVVMFGVPPALLWDPLEGAPTGAIEEAAVLAALDAGIGIGQAPHGAPGPEAGAVEAIVIAPVAEAPGREVERAVAVAGSGLEGDRYAAGAGTFSPKGGDGRELTLIEAEALDAVGLSPADARRNVVTRGVRLNALMGYTFRVGSVTCAGRRLCEPCAHLERLTSPGMLRALVHRGGLRADILEGGDIEVGAAVSAVEPLQPG